MKAKKTSICQRTLDGRFCGRSWQRFVVVVVVGAIIMWGGQNGSNWQKISVFSQFYSTFGVSVRVKMGQFGNISFGLPPWHRWGFLRVSRLYLLLYISLQDSQSSE